MHYLITGGTGFIGSALVPSLLGDGHSVTILSRSAGLDEKALRFVTDLDNISSDTHIDTVINLAGASMAGARWSEKYKREIVASRLTITEALVALMARLDTPPAVFLSASAIGYYGHHGDEPLAEDGATVPGFSQDLCQRWEEAATRAGDLGVRVCLLRLGVVLDAGGGALEEMVRPFKFGVANWIGSGKQWLSWVHRQDVVAAIRFLQEHPDLRGAFNITAPEPVTSRGFCDVMKRHKRTLITAPVPAPAIRLLVGGMADELLLKGQRVVPSRLQEAQFSFAYPDLESALQAIF